MAKMNDKPVSTDPCAEVWSLWEAYADRFITDDGRVIDLTDGGHSTSEGQAYGLFHALVANDRERFDLLLTWTSDNLAGGDLAAHLPGWKWGRDVEGGWRLLDENPASDADLWLAYTLIEAGRLWKEPRYDALGRGVAQAIAEREVVELPGAGPMLTPGPEGFAPEEGGWRLNPSYLPIQLLRGLATAHDTGPWASIADGTVRMLRETAPHGFAADWVTYTADAGYVPDAVSGPVGSHDAIRCYLWAGTLHPDDPHRPALDYQLSGPVRFWRRWGHAPMEVNPWTFEDSGREGSVGFLGALLPQVTAGGDAEASGRLRAQIEAQSKEGLYGDPATYYDQNLLLFGLGHADERYRFEADGTLRPWWEEKCGPR
jgi:endoglucanase